MFQIRNRRRILFHGLNRKVDCFQPSPYTWAQLRGSDFGFQCFTATPLVFSQKSPDPCKLLYSSRGAGAEAGVRKRALVLRVLGWDAEHAPKRRYQEQENLKQARFASGLERSDSL
jgi:hypothetical protein